MLTSRSLVCTVLSLLTVGVCRAIGDEKPTAKAEIERVKCRVRVVDALGKPVQGAIVVPSGFRTRVEPGSHWGWATLLFGALPKVETGADGIAEIEVPKYVMEKQTIGQVTWLVDDPDHVVYR